MAGRSKKTHCKHGHPRTPDNVYSSNGGCIVCNRTSVVQWNKENPGRKAERERKWREKNKEYDKERQRQWTKENPERRRAITISSQTGLDKELVYQYLLDRKDVSVCDICQQEWITGISLHLDHDHETGKIRGLLCGNCNRGLGVFKDSVKFLELATEYLKAVK